MLISGDCCWVLYNKKNFRGLQSIIGPNFYVKSLKQLGRGRYKISSVKKFEKCNGVL